MASHHQSSGNQRQNVVRERLLFPILFPLAALLATVVPIVLIGEILLLFNGHFNVGDEHVVYAIFPALGLTFLVLIGGAFLSRTWAKDE